jgi:hypothetical protein
VNALALDTTCWTEAEFAHLDLGDARLNKRARTLMERLAAKATAGVPQVAAYRVAGRNADTSV